MNSFYRKIKILQGAVVGLFIKLWWWICFAKKNSDGLNDESRDKLIIVSLTSYGRRVKATVPYTLISLLRQTVKPDKILLWLDNENWTKDNLPSRLKRLMALGVEIKFCDDLKSYKKLIPTLDLYPHDIIITVDDDVFYKKDLVEKLYSKYLEMSLDKAVYCNVAHLPLKSNSGDLLAYSDWKFDISEDLGNNVFPVGVGGILYSPNSLDSDVVRKDIFENKVPYADDVWFWVMALKKNTPRYWVKRRGKSYWDIDFLYQISHNKSALNHMNVLGERNDSQIKNVLEYYNLKL